MDLDLTGEPASAGAVDALDVLATLTAASDLADVYVLEGTGTLTDRLRLLVAADALASTLGILRKRLTESCAADMDGPVEVDGMSYVVKTGMKRTKWDKPALRSIINRTALGRRLDEETGELTRPTPEEAVDRLWEFVDVATGRTKVLREQLEIDLDDYCHEEPDAPRIEPAE